MSLQTLARACALWLCAGMATGASAHGVPHGTGTLRLNGDRVFSVLSFPVSLLAEGDDDRDGRLSREELQRNRSAISAQLRDQLRVESGREQGEVMFEDLLLPHAEEGSTDIPPSTHVGLMRSTRFSHAVTAPRLVARLFEGPEENAQFQATFLDERGEVLDRATLSRAVPAWRFRAGPLEVAGLHARGAVGWLAGVPAAWGLLGLALGCGAFLRRRPRQALLAATASGSALLLSRAFSEHARYGRELPHTLAGGMGGAVVLAAFTVAAFGAGRVLAAARPGR